MHVINAYLIGLRVTAMVTRQARGKRWIAWRGLTVWAVVTRQARVPSDFHLYVCRKSIYLKIENKQIAIYVY